MILFKVGDKLKVGLFEAKWPRLLKDPGYDWDYGQKKTKLSHFTSQIERQAKWAHQAAIWEMFFYEEKVGTQDALFDKNASTCIQHQFAKQLVKSTSSLQTLWNNDDLKNLIKLEQASQSGAVKEINLKQIIFDILTCNLGKVIKVAPSDRTFNLKSSDNKESVKCPIITVFDSNEDTERIQGFMAANGLSLFLQVDIATDSR